MTDPCGPKTPASRYDYELPRELIAQTPISVRSASRLLVLDRRTGAVEHRSFPDLVEYLEPGDALAVNDSRVTPAEIELRKETGARITGLVFGRDPAGDLRALMRPGKRLRPGMTLETPDRGRVLAVEPGTETGEWLLRPLDQRAAEFIETGGRVALPHYIHEPLGDQERYQTVFAHRPGSLAAPTAGLHFDDAVLDRIEARGVTVARVTLHVGLATFRPVMADYIEDHRLGAEQWEVDHDAVAAVNAARDLGRRVIVVGTTAVRTLETAGASGRLKPGRGRTELFITEGFDFQITDRLLTNFHLPRSTLLTLVCAFAGRDRTLAAYAEAVRLGYRFYSFGDAMLIL